ncbi:hypothetical protein PV327_003545 [Microctonus hyperodae]|uniref:Proteasome assembly chaperone 4 n=1 Tax=Microctonus hyperodae TaxID=165561 RepID=A0AA39G562_MICHY|nr:hypothetical protein PV327_003545 [Microctonus hyperodae]
MADIDVNNSNIELLSSNFKFHNFDVQVGEVKYFCEIIIMQNSFFLWIGDSNNGKMNDLSFGFKSNYENTPISTKLMGSMDDTTSLNIAKRLTKKYEKPVYISFNAPVNNSLLPKIEQGICEELKKHPEILA